MLSQLSSLNLPSFYFNCCTNKPKSSWLWRTHFVCILPSFMLNSRRTLTLIMPHHLQPLTLCVFLLDLMVFHIKSKIVIILVVNEFESTQRRCNGSMKIAYKYWFHKKHFLFEKAPILSYNLFNFKCNYYFRLKCYSEVHGIYRVVTSFCISSRNFCVRSIVFMAVCSAIELQWTLCICLCYQFKFALTI